MDIETIFLVLFWGAVIWWIWRANNPKNKQSEPSTGDDMKFTSGPGKKSQSREPFLEAIETERHASELRTHAEANAYKQAVEDSISEDMALKTRLAAFARANHLDTALAEIWEAIQHYPTWSQRDDWQQWNTLELESPSEEVVDFRNKTVHFIYKGTPFSIEMKRWDGMQSSTYEDYHLLENGEEMFAISCSVEYGDHYTSIRPVDIKAFKKRGTWASMLISLHAKKKLESEKSSADLRARMADQIRGRFEE